ncbi:ATP-NAD kinase-like domain-containing protein [Russula ochroleuca]|uniref:ATP-NAD kinase-like domain-containing protein n=1 Tax=Russula ochroleuca TaxID=152965 RepID=A0A9P5MU23_9AGAM|nr:ATP-NAD kinase-like domain-containing protein [Russula ochroleuca]
MVATNSRQLVLIGTLGQLPVQFSFDSTSFTFRDSSKTSPDVHVPLSHVLSVDVSGSVVDAHVLVRNRGHLDVVNISGNFQEDDSEASSAAKDWVQGVMTAAYSGVKECRRLLVVVNPHGGRGKAISIFNHEVEPILKAARCRYKAVYTEYGGHAEEIASQISLDDYDAVVTVSGDGTVHELINGFAQHREPMKAFRMPIAPIPAGSGNAASLNLLGVEDGANVTAATLNAIKGRPMAVDVLSILQSGKRSFSFLSQCVGLMADIDLGTEHLRWMGSSRFTYGFLRGVLTRKAYQFSISVKTVMSEKEKMAEALQEYNSSAPHYDVPPVEEGDATALPPLQYVDKQDGWTTFEGPILHMYAGKGPFVSSDLMQFPVAMPNDGVVDIVIQGMISRVDMLKSYDGAETGALYWQDKAQYFKASAYRLRPLQEDGNLSIDGERLPFKEYYAEVHRGLATMLSMSGRYPVDFTLERPPGSA